MWVKLNNGHTIEVAFNKTGLVHYKRGDYDKYYIQIIENSKIVEIEISKEEYERLLRFK